MQVVSFAREERMFLNVQHHIKIARRAAMQTSLTQSRKPYARSIFHTRRNLGIDNLQSQYSSFPFAFRAGIGDHAARALARRTSSCNAEKSLLIAHLPVSVTGTAGHRGLAFSSARAPAFLARLM